MDKPRVTSGNSDTVARRRRFCFYVQLLRGSADSHFGLDQKLKQAQI